MLKLWPIVTSPVLLRRPFGYCKLRHKTTQYALDVLDDDSILYDEYPMALRCLRPHYVENTGSRPITEVK